MVYVSDQSDLIFIQSILRQAQIESEKFLVDGYLTTSFSGEGNFPTPWEIADAMNKDPYWMGTIITGFYDTMQTPQHAVIEGYLQARYKLKEGKVVVPAQVVQCGDYRDYYLVGIIYKKPIQRSEDIYIGRSLEEIHDFARERGHIVFYPHPFAPTNSVIWQVYGASAFARILSPTVDFSDAELDGVPLFPEDERLPIAIDVANGRAHGFNSFAAMLQKKLDLPYIAGSNAREIRYAREPALVFEEKIESANELLNLLLDKKCEVHMPISLNAMKNMRDAGKEFIRFLRR